jgi:hypothetical protein
LVDDSKDKLRINKKKYKMKKLFVLLMACASLIACDEKGNDQAEIAALEKQAADVRFVERLSEVFIDTSTNQPIGLKLDEEGTYAIGTEDGEVARIIVKYLMEEAETVVTGDEQSYRYAYTFADGRKVEAAGSLTSSGGVYATLRLDVKDMPDFSTMLIKTVAALQDDNSGGLPPGRRCLYPNGKSACAFF